MRLCGEAHEGICPLGSMIRSVGIALKMCSTELGHLAREILLGNDNNEAEASLKKSD